MTDLTPELEENRKKIEKFAVDYGLEFFDTIFEIVDYDQINEIVSYLGFPIRYPHWKFGMEYEKNRKLEQYGFVRIGEMVINNNPCYAYLNEANELWRQKMVIAHVYGHCDFFKNNAFFTKTNRNMVNEMANHANKIESYTSEHGINNIESFLTTCMSIDDLIDYQYLDAPPPSSEVEKGKGSSKFEAKGYMDKFINPPESIKKKQQEEELKKKEAKKFQPTRDIMLFLIENAPLEPWQRNILSMLREESYYFSPQWQTKIMNEGWATYWHSKIMTEKDIAGPDIFAYTDYHSKVIFMQNSINPYKLGLELFRDIEDRWNKGKFGKKFEECINLDEKENWDKKLNLGRKKIFEVRKTHNDVTFINEFFTEELCRALNLHLTKKDPESNDLIIDKNYKQVKDFLLNHLINAGKPFIYLENDNYGNRGELYLKHDYTGRILHLDKTITTLKSIYSLWKRPVYLESMVKSSTKENSLLGILFFCNEKGCFGKLKNIEDVFLLEK